MHKLKQEQLIGLLFVTALHGVGLYGLLRYEFIPIRDEAVVLMANFINPPVPEPEQPKPPEPDLPKPRPVEPPKPKQLVAQTPVVLPDEPVIPVPPPEPVVEPIPLDPQPIESPKPQQLVAQAPVVLPAPPEVIALSSELSVICLERAAPYYPTLSKRMDEQGRVVLRVRLGEDGKVTNAIIQTSSGFARLDNAALEAVRTWRCNPPVRNGVVMSASALQPFNFSLSQ
ncbi:MAG: energy transducer TonB [Candidatus Nitrotoga sp.]